MCKNLSLALVAFELTGPSPLWRNNCGANIKRPSLAPSWEVKLFSMFLGGLNCCEIQIPGVLLTSCTTHHQPIRKTVICSLRHNTSSNIYTSYLVWCYTEQAKQPWDTPQSGFSYLSCYSGKSQGPLNRWPVKCTLAVNAGSESGGNSMQVRWFQTSIKIPYWSHVNLLHKETEASGDW